MPISEEKKRELFETAVALSKHGLFCRCCALIWTRNQLSAWSGMDFPDPGSWSAANDHSAKESVIEALVSYGDSPQFGSNLLQTHAILGHALIIRALGSDAAAHIAHAYLAKRNAKLCAALLLWVGKNPELTEVVDKVTLPPGLAEALFLNARSALYDKAIIHISNSKERLWARMPSEINILPIHIIINDDN